LALTSHVHGRMTRGAVIAWGPGVGEGGRPSVAINAGHVRGGARGRGGKSFPSVFSRALAAEDGGKGSLEGEGGPPVSGVGLGRSAWRGIWPLRGRWTAEGGI
jgi:hypothetical protein